MMRLRKLQSKTNEMVEGEDAHADEVCEQLRILLHGIPSFGERGEGGALEPSSAGKKLPTQIIRQAVLLGSFAESAVE